MLARVIGNVTSTMKDRHYQGQKLLLVRPVRPDMSPAGRPLIAADAVRAGIGDLVIVFDEGGSARQMLDYEAGVTIRTVIGGIVDAVEIGSEET